MSFLWSGLQLHYCLSNHDLGPTHQAAVRFQIKSVSSCSLHCVASEVHIIVSEEPVASSIFYPEDGGNGLLRNFCTYVPNYMSSHPRMLTNVRSPDFMHHLTQPIESTCHAGAINVLAPYWLPSDKVRIATALTASASCSRATNRQSE
jgi:hypothetical protein